MDKQNRVFLSTIDLITDISLTKPQITGTIFLTSYKDSFFIHWIPFDGTPTQLITTVFHSAPELTIEEWSPNQPFLVYCNDISFIEFQYKKNLLFLLLHHNKFKQSRIFYIDISQYVSIIRFIEQLLVNGIAVPGVKYKYCLEIYKNCRIDTFSFKPLYIKLQDFQFKGMKNLWSKINNFYESYLSQLDSSGTIPNDPEFPLAAAARASHALFLERIQSEITNIPNYEKITEEEFPSLFDDEGRIIDQELFRKRLYHSGIDSSTSNKLLISILPFALGIYPLNSTLEKRKQIDEELEYNFQSLYEQMINIQDSQKKQSKRITEAYRVIGNDVFRTDRQLNTFKNPKGIGSQILTNYLRMYSVLNPVLSYLQGMNDLFVPIIRAYLPDWTEDSSPIIDQAELDSIKQKNINITLKCDQQFDSYISHVSPKIFWCFDSMLKMTNQFALLADVTEYCKGVADIIHSILNDFSPIAATWMRRSGIKDLIWCYGDFVMMFKRTFSGDIWSLWLQFCCSPNPTRWMTYFMCAIIVATFDKLACLPDVQLNAMMDAFPKILQSLDRHEIGEIAMWLAMEHPLPPIHSNEENCEVSKTEFNFFRTLSSGNWGKLKREEKDRKEIDKKLTNYKENYSNKDVINNQPEPLETEINNFNDNKDQISDEIKLGSNNNASGEESSEGFESMSIVFEDVVTNEIPSQISNENEISNENDNQNQNENTQNIKDESMESFDIEFKELDLNAEKQ